MAITKRVRFEVFRRDSFKCRYCGITATEEATGLTVDHVVPKSLGGTDDPSNLVTACSPCNSGKSSTQPDGPLVADVANDSLRWASALKQAAARLETDRLERKRLVDEFDEQWRGWTMNRKQVPRPPEWDQSLITMLAAGLPMASALELVRVSMESEAGITQKWRYFCGCCWNVIRDLQDVAKGILTNATDDTEEEDEDSACGHCDACLNPTEYRGGCFYPPCGDDDCECGERCPHCDRCGCLYLLGRAEGRSEGLRESFGLRDALIRAVDNRIGSAKEMLDAGAVIHELNADRFEAADDGAPDWWPLFKRIFGPELYRMGVFDLDPDERSFDVEDCPF